jgi:hypothetical protein
MGEMMGIDAAVSFRPLEASGRPWRRREAGRRQHRVRPMSVWEEEEGGWLGRAVAWAGWEAEAQWRRGGKIGR